MPKVLTTAPTEEPVSLDEVKAHVLVDHSADDIYLNSLIVAARMHVENYLQRALVTQTWDLYLDAFPDEIEIPLPPLVSITHIKYYDTGGTLQTLSESNYTVDTYSQPGRVVLAYSCSWPATRSIINAVTIRFVAGYGAASAVPRHIRQAILLKVADLYENRGDVAAGEFASIDVLERAMESLLGADRIVPV
jgi:uncharacterized phiE125 gp8 family phage protein